MLAAAFSHIVRGTKFHGLQFKAEGQEKIKISIDYHVAHRIEVMLAALHRIIGVRMRKLGNTIYKLVRV